MDRVKPFLCGGVASCIAELGKYHSNSSFIISSNVIITIATYRLLLHYHIHVGTFPVDTTKTRLQIQEGFHSMKYKGMFDCGIKIFKEEGFRSLYNGISPGKYNNNI